jgi:hypothetical protein
VKEERRQIGKALVVVQNRVLQLLACYLPVARPGGLAASMARRHIGKDVWIDYDAITETASPKLVTIRATIQIRATIIADFREQRGVLIEEDVRVGPDAIILPSVFVSWTANLLAEALSRKSTEELHAKDLRAYRNLILIEKTIHI